MTTILFIHGTGVRDAGINEYLEQLRRGVQRIRGEVTVHATRWGDIVGASLLAGGASIPADLLRQRSEVAALRTLVEPGPEDSQLALWEIMDTAPLVELDALSSASRVAHPARDEQTARTVVDRLGRALEPGTDLHGKLANAGLGPTAMAAATQLVASDQFTDIVENPQLGIEQKAACLARAFTALALGLRDAELGCLAPVDGQHREAVELAAAQAVAHPDVPPGAIQPQLKGIILDRVLSLVTNWAARNRVRLTQEAATGIGDTLKYLSRGRALRQLIGQDLDAIEDDEVIVVAHSLGAVACLDLLIDNRHPKVGMLVAVATQSGLLFELDALPSQRFAKGYQLPQDFPATHFVYDPRDLLAYKSGGLFGPGITDHRIDNRAPFPRNHGAYFTNDAFYELLDRILPRRGEPGR
ncbi:hypothetical protein OK351_05665 [Glutamicibacter sp. MNS18]|uniref:hypothetical protein n=1 Tax=Glutamicibacter sp. MNS18 TaxID=2989817 RepID=UPI0022369066|nr:hypothetical protein [Glutamicibacter sp. MNS18]MCW4464989.1 hypothetical protein [Glutamicibacter sp. MNS18]